MGQKKYPDELRERATRTGVGGAGRPGTGLGCDPQDRRRAGCLPRGSTVLGQEGPGRWWSEAGSHHRRGTADQGAGEGGPRAAKSQRGPEERVGLSIAAECERPSR